MYARARLVDGKYISNYYTKSEADDRFVNVAGDTMRGNLILKNSKLWVQSENPYSGETNRMSMTEGHPDFLPFSDSNSSNKVGLCLYANAIAIRDTLYRDRNANDSCWIRFIESTNNSGYMEIGTGDDGTEPIYFRGYNTSSEIAWESYVSSGHFYSPGFHHTSQNSNNYILLAGGSYKAISDFSLSGHSHTFKLGSTTITTNGTQYSSITGPFAVNTGDSASNAFSIQRSSSYEVVRHWVDDNQYHIDYTNNETSSSIHIRIINTDAESGNKTNTTDYHYYLDCYGNFYPGSNNTGSIGASSYKWANMYATTFHGNLDGVATYATHLNASYLYSSSSWNWNPFGFDNQYWCWGESFRNNSISADTGDIRFYITGVTSNGVTGQTICSMNIDGGIASAYKIYARDGFIHGGISSNANSYVLLAGGSYALLNFVSKSGDTMAGALTIKGVTDSGQYSQGGFNKAYANIILQGDNTYGVSGIVFKSMKANDTNINTPSDVAFIQYHPYGVTAGAYNTTPAEASSGERSRFVIGVGNDADEGSVEYGEELWLQTAGFKDLKHVVVNSSQSPVKYTIWDAGNDGSGSGLDADLLDGYHFSDIEDRYVNVTGDTMTGSLTFSTDSAITWSRNTDYASIRFQNTGDGDTNSYLDLQTGDNGNEYIRLSRNGGGTVYEMASFKSDGATINGFITAETYNTWLSPSRTQLGRKDATIYTDRSCIGTTDGNLHIDSYKNKDIHLNYYCSGEGDSQGRIYFNGSSYYIKGGYYNGTAAYASSAGNADTLDGYHYNSFAWSSHSHSTLETYFKFVSSDVTEAAVNLASSTTAHTMTFYRNGISIPYQMDNSNDGGLLRVRGTTESNVIYEMATWDDSGEGETIQFNYYPTSSAATPTYSVSVPKKSGTIALTNDIPSSLPANGGNAASVTVNDSDANSTYRMVWHSGNTLYGTGGIYCNPYSDCIYASHYYETSDIRLKTDFENLNVSINSIASLPVFDFSWKDKIKNRNTGTSAQAVQAVFPNIVTESNNTLKLDYGVLGTASSIIIAREVLRLKEEIHQLKQKLGIIE